MARPQVGEIWEDRNGVHWGPLEENDGRITFKKDYPLVHWRGENWQMAWTNEGEYLAGTMHNKDLVRLVRVSEADAKMEPWPVVPPPAPMDGLTATLAERAKTHGEYKSHARVTQALKEVIRTGDTYGQCSDHEKETLDMIAHKIGRIVSGDPHFTDHWHDIAGYARLSEERNK